MIKTIISSCYCVGFKNIHVMSPFNSYLRNPQTLKTYSLFAVYTFPSLFVELRQTALKSEFATKKDFNQHVWTGHACYV